LGVTPVGRVHYADNGHAGQTDLDREHHQRFTIDDNTVNPQRPRQLEDSFGTGGDRLNAKRHDVLAINLHSALCMQSLKIGKAVAIGYEKTIHMK
jgi:hypothetical protein